MHIANLQARYSHDGIAAAATLEGGSGAAVFKAFLQFKHEPSKEQLEDFLLKFESFTDSCFEPLSPTHNEAPRLVAVKSA